MSNCECTHTHTLTNACKCVRALICIVLRVCKSLLVSSFSFECRLHFQLLINKCSVFKLNEEIHAHTGTYKKTVQSSICAAQTTVSAEMPKSSTPPAAQLRLSIFSQRQPFKCLLATVLLLCCLQSLHINCRKFYLILFEIFVNYDKAHTHARACIWLTI